MPPEREIRDAQSRPCQVIVDTLAAYAAVEALAAYAAWHSEVAAG